jgi:integrase
MASVRARPDGRLFFDFRFRGIRCRELTTLADTAANRRKMKKVLVTIESEIAGGTFDYERFFPGSKTAFQFAKPKTGTRVLAANLSPTSGSVSSGDGLPTFREFTADWLVEKQVEWRHSHRSNVDSTLNGHLYPAFGDLPIDQITREAVLGFRAELAAKQVRMPNKKAAGGRTISTATINKILGILRMILDEAALRFGTRNPCTLIKRLKVQRKDIEPFALDEVQQILARVRADYQPYFTVRFLTGMRSGEAHGLKWKHIDFARRQILIRETYQNGRTEYTKTAGSQREIHMSQPVSDALSKMIPEGHATDPQAFADQYVFRTRNGNPIDNTNFNDRVWKPLLRNLGLAYRRPYQMRHTCATLWLASGESPEWIARQLGHTTTEMLFRTYSRYVPNLMRRDGSAFDRMIVGAMHGGVTTQTDEEVTA